MTVSTLIHHRIVIIASSSRTFVYYLNLIMSYFFIGTFFCVELLNFYVAIVINNNFMLHTVLKAHFILIPVPNCQ